MKYLAMLGGLVLTLAVAGRAQIAQADCEERLDNNAYFCTFTPQEGPPFSDCVFFNSENPYFGDFDMYVDGLALGCSCETKNPKKFKKSNNFLCVGTENENVSEGIVFGGKATAKGKKITKGQVVEEDGFSYIYTCTLEPACELGM